MPENAKSDLGLHSLPRYHKKDTRLIWRLPHPVACQSSLILNNAIVFLLNLTRVLQSICTLAQILINNNIKHKIVNIFLSISYNMHLGAQRTFSLRWFFRVHITYVLVEI